MAKNQTKGYPWKYCSLGGVVRVNITSGEDIAHLGELDQKLWTVLSCLLSPYPGAPWWTGTGRREGLASQLCYLGLFFLFSCFSAFIH